MIFILNLRRNPVLIANRVCLCDINGSSKVIEVLDEWWIEPQMIQTNLCMRTYLFSNNAFIADKKIF